MRRGRKVGIVLMVVFVLLVGLVVVADRVLASVAENKIADQAASEMRRNGATAAARPEVEISGFPFLTQVLGGAYEKITITAQRPESNGIKLETLTLVATDLKASAGDLINGRGQIVASQLTGTASMGWDTVKSLIELSGLQVPVDPSQLQIKVVDDKVELRLPVSFGRYSTTLRANGVISVADGKVRLQLSDVAAEGAALPREGQALLNQYKNRLSATIRTPQMPYRLVVKAVRSDASGVHVTATAADVRLAG